MKLFSYILLCVIKGIVKSWGFSTNWIYKILTNPDEKLKNSTKVLAMPETSTCNEVNTEIYSFFKL